jgi:hypothetical protein
MDTYLMMARLVYVLDWTVYLLPRVLTGMAIGAAAWGVGRLIRMRRR